MPTFFSTLPGIAVIQGVVNRQIFNFTTALAPAYRPTNGIINGSLSRDTGSSDLGGATSGGNLTTPSVTSTPTILRAGLLMGIITGNSTLPGQYRPSVYGLSTGAITGNSTVTPTVPATVATELARQIYLAGASVNITIAGPATTGGTMQNEIVACSAGNATAGTITIAKTVNSYVAGSLVQAADGSQDPVTVITVQNGIDVTDITGKSINQAINADLGLPISGDLLSAMIVNLLTDDFGNTVEPSCTAYLKSRLSLPGRATFTFSDSTN